MKYIIAIISLIFCSVLFSCKKDFLNKTDPTRIGVDIFYQDAAQVNRAINGIYGQLQGITSVNYIFKEMQSDNTTIDMNPSDRGGAAGWEAFEYSTVNPGNGEISNLWNRYYSALYNVNLSIEKLSASTTIDDAVKKPLDAELKFLRAFLYFDLVRYFGNVALVTNTFKTPAEAFEIIRTESVDQVYTQIETDLKEAVAGLLTRSDQPAAQRGRATKGSALATLGEMYLTVKKYPEAVSTLQSILPMGYDLVPDYADVFGTENKNNIESVFEIQYQGDNDLGEQSNFMYVFAPRESSSSIVGFAGQGLGGRNIPTNNMIAAYEAGDLRKDVSLKTGFTKDGVLYPIPYVNKYNHPHNIPGRTNDNWPIYRYANVLLMLAEAINESTGPGSVAEGYLNEVRHRAGLDPLSGLGKDAFRTAVLKERRVELAFENHRWFDLKRTMTPAELAAFMNAHGTAEKANPTVPRGGVAFNQLDYIYEPHEYLLPVPAPQILINSKLTQNDGYN
ncbi:RagB/SusD family nutrient uptake outer membrane protein [Agriterribacter sp.]|uniref:RagB/SusD family nutrient uptake outer membrane protein n=1 Tax=Agriterribacter sp. TaxID=2821509 RepID=UPI002CCD923B|nr:RagB/SusD family nutrient uptake outer membrane protein [Agriterribacter sp.]HRO46074.1 RagB/SusD family nutrient uptake outer membrane protein [Agriterribacter sp.]HRQ16134.1 RagB/SusD family nutrient uptake outer membrane protein [Agriterribacter sp.]